MRYVQCSYTVIVGIVWHEIHKTHSMLLLLLLLPLLSIYHSYRIVKKLRIALILLERNWNAWVPWMTGNLIVCIVVRNAVGQEDAVVLVNCKKSLVAPVLYTNNISSPAPHGWFRNICVGLRATLKDVLFRVQNTIDPHVCYPTWIRGVSCSVS